jgi:outer membrane PBP1 activator LpoA protein
MTENVDTTTPAPDADATPASEADTTTPKPTETVDFWKQKAREQEKRAKDNAEAAKRLSELEESQKTESQRLTERADTEYKRAQDAEAKLLRYEVAAETGVPATALKFLTGSSREEIEASAKDVLDLIGNAGKPRTPKPDLNQGRPAAEATSKVAQFEAFLNQQS